MSCAMARRDCTPSVTRDGGMYGGKIANPNRAASNLRKIVWFPFNRAIARLSGRSEKASNFKTSSLAAPLAGRGLRFDFADEGGGAARDCPPAGPPRVFL